MAGIYIHIPYCRQKCNYCNFFSIVSKKTLPEMITAICREAQIRSKENNAAIETIYLGGGTPSLIDDHLLIRLLGTIKHHYQVIPEAEITLEANPDDITPANLEHWKAAGINRLSIGIQSFHEADLKYLNRVHPADQAYNCIALAREFGFPDLTIDLIYGIPTLDHNHWKQNLEIFADLNLPHLSAYALTVEPRTPLHLMIEKGQTKPVEEKQSSEQFEILLDFMEQRGYLHYEISNFCLPGKYAKHNLSYWKGIAYYGFGPSAHSFNINRRQWNVSSVSEYLKQINEGILPFESEDLSLEESYNEYVMTGLRTMWGCQIRDIEEKFGSDFKDYFIVQSIKWLDRLLMKEDNGNYLLTKEGKLLADGIASDLFYV